MIHFDDWLLTKDEGPVIARQYDNLTRRLEILGDIPEGWSWTLLVQADKHLDIIALVPMEGGLGVDLTKEMLAIGGYHTLQLKGTKGELVRHTNQLHNVLIPASLSGDANWPEVPSEFSQIEANIRELGAHPPIPGDQGFWLVWDLERDEYVTSDLPLPNVSVGPAGKAATIKVGETITGDPDTQAKVENTGTENAAVLRFTIPRGAVGPTGATPAISVEVTGLPAGAEPTVSVSGTPEEPVIALGIPQGKQGDPGGKGDPGDPGQTPNITIGQVETLPAGSSVTASITGQTPNLVLNLGIPQGKQGDTGDGVPPADDVPTDYLLSVGGWVPPPSGGEKEWKSKTITIDAEVQSVVLFDDLSGISEVVFLGTVVNPTDNPVSANVVGLLDCSADDVQYVRHRVTNAILPSKSSAIFAKVQLEPCFLAYGPQGAGGATNWNTSTLTNNISGPSQLNSRYKEMKFSGNQGAYMGAGSQFVLFWR